VKKVTAVLRRKLWVFNQIKNSKVIDSIYISIIVGQEGMAIGHFFARLRLEWPPHPKGAEPQLLIFNRFRQSAYQVIDLHANSN
jgi:hypothetical protein